MPFSSWLKSTWYILPAKALRAHNQAHTISQLRASFSEGQSAPLESLTSFQPRLRCSWPEPNATMPPSPGMCQDTSWSSSYKASLAMLQKLLVKHLIHLLHPNLQICFGFCRFSPFGFGLLLLFWNPKAFSYLGPAPQNPISRSGHRKDLLPACREPIASPAFNPVDFSIFLHVSV